MINRLFIVLVLALGVSLAHAQSDEDPIDGPVVNGPWLDVGCGDQIDCVNPFDETTGPTSESILVDGQVLAKFCGAAKLKSVHMSDADGGGYGEKLCRTCQNYNMAGAPVGGSYDECI